jgi:hypothetical protein
MPPLRIGSPISSYHDPRDYGIAPVGCNYGESNTGTKPSGFGASNSFSVASKGWRQSYASVFTPGQAMAQDFCCGEDAAFRIILKKTRPNTIRTVKIMANTLLPISIPTSGNQSPSNPANLPAESENLEKRYDDLLAERQLLRAELARTQHQRDQLMGTVSYFMSKDYVCPYSSEEILSVVDSQPPLRDLIAELEQTAESRG